MATTAITKPAGDKSAYPAQMDTSQADALKEAATQTAASASPNVAIGGSALTPPNVTGGYNKAAADMKSGTLESDIGYTSAFTRNEETGALEGAPTIAKGETFNTPQTTVAGQIEKLVAEDSKLNQMAQAEAREQASALGMSRSSMAIGAAQKALYETALPIAEADAKTATAFKAQEQLDVNKQAMVETESMAAGQLVLQKAQLQEQSDRLKASWETTIKGLDQQSQVALEGFRGEIEGKTQELTMNLQKQLNQQQINANVQEKIMTQSQEALNNYQVTIQQLLGNQAFLDSMKDKKAMNDVFNNLFDTVSSAITFSAKSAGAYTTQMSTYVSDLVKSNTWS